MRTAAKLMVGMLTLTTAGLVVGAQQRPTEPQPSTPSTRQPVQTPPNSSASEPLPSSADNKNAVEAKPNAEGFKSPGAAAAALCHAARSNDSEQLLTVLGPDGNDLVNWSEDGGEDLDRQQFVEKYTEMHRLVREPDDTVTLYVGAENWPLPIPIVEYEGKWYFDTELGKQEILYRQIGRNEIDALNVCQALVDAEKEYDALNHKYADKFVSSDGRRDGLYWPNSGTGARSPIGRYLAQSGITGASTGNQMPYHGYFYRILLRTAAAPASDVAHSGFVVEAFPAQYRTSGVMTFFMEENGNAYERDLGPSTDQAALQITTFQPDKGWHKVDEGGNKQATK